MINKKRRFAAIVATLFIILTTVLTVLPAAAVESPEVNGGEAVVLYDKTHKRYIVEENGFAMLNTSTSAKIMMGLIACETLSDRLDQTVTITEEMISARKLKLRIFSTARYAARTTMRLMRSPTSAAARDL